MTVAICFTKLAITAIVAFVSGVTVGAVAYAMRLERASKRKKEGEP